MKRIYTILAAVLITASVFAQTPEKMTYQAVVRDDNSTLIISTQVGIEINIYQTSASGTLVYTETQTPTTNINGLLSIEIGGQTGFDLIDWANGPYFIETNIDVAGGTNYTITGVSQLLTVPYALHAKTAETITGGITETDPVYTNSQANNIIATDITNLSNLSGVNTGDQDISGIATNTQAIQDTASQIRADIPDVNGFVTTEADPVFTNSQANNITSADITNISNLSGTNTGDQDISGIATNTQAIQDTANQIRADIPDVNGFITTEADPVFTNSQANNITSADITKLSNLSGTNTGDQDINGIATNTQAIQDTASQIRADIPDVSGFITTEADPVFTGSEANNITSQHITDLGNLSGTNTGDQQISRTGLTVTLSNGGTYQDSVNMQNLDNVLSMGNDAGNKTITHLADPTDAQDAATKAYIDALIEQLYAQGALRVRDYDGNYYNTIKIGNQIWMVENLKVTHYPNGNPIPNITGNTDWKNLVYDDDAYCYYTNSTDSAAKYGALYTYEAANNACPTGWHLPTDVEWTDLENYINIEHSGTEGTALKSTSGWNSSGNGTDDYGFTAFPGGYRKSNDGTFYDVGNNGYWWSNTSYGLQEAYYRFLMYNQSVVYRIYGEKSFGFSVRCVRD